VGPTETRPAAHSFAAQGVVVSALHADDLSAAKLSRLKGGCQVDRRTGKVLASIDGCRSPCIAAEFVFDQPYRYDEHCGVGHAFAALLEKSFIMR